MTQPHEHPDTPSDLEGGPDTPHRPADDREEIYYQGSPLLRGEIGRLMLCCIFGPLIIIAPILWRILQGTWTYWWVWPVCLVIGLIILLLPPLFTRTIRYRISNYRIDYERGILSRRIDTLELWHVEDISYHQSLIDRMLRVGTITIMSRDDTTPVLELHGLPSPRPLFDSLKQRIIAVKRQRGVIKMDVG